MITGPPRSIESMVEQALGGARKSRAALRSRANETGFADAVLKALPTVITVRRQWNDWRTADYKGDSLSGLHWSSLSGGVRGFAPRPFIHAYVFCNAMIAGELAHSCAHGEGPHEIKVCIVKRDNPKIFWILELIAG